MDKDSEYLDIVDDNNQVVGRESYRKIYEYKLSHRIVHVFVVNSKGQLLLQKRSKTKEFHPGSLCTAAAGHVQSGETYEEAGKRELYEELGIKDIELDKLRDFLHIKPDNSKKFLCVFQCVWNGEFKLNYNEVESAKFYALDYLRKNIDKMKITPELRQILEWYLWRP